MRTLLCSCGLLLMLGVAFAAEEKGPLKVVPIAGDGALNDVRRRIGHDIVVEVRDEYDRRVPNARVVFTLPMSGAGAAFPDDRRELITSTDEQGRATARGLKPNSLEGRFSIRVTASGGGRQGSATVWQSNTLAAGAEAGKGGGKGKYILLGILGGGAAAGLAVALGGGNGGSSGGGGPVVPTTLSPGTVTVGGPR